MASRFILREKATQTFCKSSKFRMFTAELNDAALFSTRENAEKTVRALNKFFTKEVCIYGGNSWQVESPAGKAEYHTFLDEYIAVLEKRGGFDATVEFLRTEVAEQAPGLEVVEVKLTIV
jgi:hypothetical protein